jgi:molecular chaperone GrpE
MNRDDNRAQQNRNPGQGGEQPDATRQGAQGSGWQQSPGQAGGQGGPGTSRQAAPEEQPQAQGEDTPEDDAGLLERLKAENAELKDRVLRLMAEMDNLRKRLEREKEEAVKYAAAQFARDMLSVADNLTRALQAVPEEKRQTGDSFLKSLVEGVEMTLRELLNTFERHNIRKIESHGRKFDPNYHEAMFEVTDTDAETGTIVQVVQEGYTHHDRVLRPAMVGVARREDTGAAGTAKKEGSPPQQKS